MSRFNYWKITGLLFAAQAVLIIKPLIDMTLSCSVGGHCGG